MKTFARHPDPFHMVKINARTLESISYYLDWMAQKLHSDALEADPEHDDCDFYLDHEFYVRELEDAVERALSPNRTPAPAPIKAPME